MRTIVYGINGKMGSLLAEEIQKDKRFELIGGIAPQSNFLSNNIYTDLNDGKVPELIIDFSHPSQLTNIINYALKYKVALVIATTGYDSNQLQLISESSKEIPIFYSANMSYGIQVMKKLILEAIEKLDDFDIEIIEKHHNQKVDSPSGTALTLFKTIQSKRECQIRKNGFIRNDRNEVGIHSVRGGTIVGEHSVIFAGNNEVLEITHHAQSKLVFVKGAIKAALFICQQKPGLYSMDDLINKGDSYER
jgi:4-hydroxy-tetrahydrodipicolinate reductase